MLQIGGQSSETLQKASVEVFSNKQCEDWYSKLDRRFEMIDTLLCAGLVYRQHTIFFLLRHKSFIVCF